VSDDDPLAMFRRTPINRQTIRQPRLDDFLSQEEIDEVFSITEELHEYIADALANPDSSLRLYADEEVRKIKSSPFYGMDCSDG